MSDSSNTAYRYALGTYLVIAGFLFYTFESLGKFLGQHIFPENASGFSIANPNFNAMNYGASVLLTVICVALLYLWENLRDYVVDVGDELTRVSWPDMPYTRKATAIVIGCVIISSIFLFAADFVFLKFINFIIGTAS